MKSFRVTTFRNLIAAIYLFYATVAIFPGVQRWYMQKFHPGRTPFAVWAPMQLVPSMYSFENRLELESIRGRLALWVNHYPLRPLFFRWDRSNLKAHVPLEARLTSRYREAMLATRYEVEWTGTAIHAHILKDDE